MKWLIARILLIINSIFAFFLLMSYLASVIRPGVLWIFAFIGMAYPFLLAANWLFILFWVFFRKWFFIISMVCVIAGWNVMGRYVQVRFGRQTVEDPGASFKLLTYNVRLFNYYQWNTDDEVQNKIMGFIHLEMPDIVCFQEFISIPGTASDMANLKKQLEYLPYVHVHYTNIIPGWINFGMATFSKYPIVDQGEIDFEETLNGTIFSDILFAGDTIRIYNSHLQSVRFRREYNNLLDSLIFHYNEKQLAEIKDISIRMKQAFIQRARQADILAADAGSSPHPVIICGDFNDTPASYIYHKISKDRKDAFVEAGSGFGTTYRGLFPPMRIDYILFNRIFKTFHFRIEKVDWSDHYPVVTEFTFLQTADSTNQHFPR
ncbi:MAG: endonuclease/exonuclease/phosphatase family protein [Bacteroidales bacterium]|nr:endonuclease/exonuclease/phosphatase family protein [Bacteroidales bacterium]